MWTFEGTEKGRVDCAGLELGVRDVYYGDAEVFGGGGCRWGMTVVNEND